MSKVFRFILCFSFLASSLAFAAISKVPSYKIESNFFSADLQGTDPQSLCSRAHPYYVTARPGSGNTYVGANQTSAGFSCITRWTINGGGQGEFAFARYMAAVCPAKSTASGSTCVCNAGLTEKDGQCVPESNCKFGNTSSAGYYDAGKNTAGGPAIMACIGGCETTFDGYFPEGNALVNGEKHYFAKGEYIQNGRECTGSAESIGQGIPVTEIPPDSCGEGQVMGKVNDKSVCTKSGADSEPATKPDDKKDQSSTTKTTTKDKDSEGNDRETTTTVKKNADGSTTTETTTTTTKSNGSGGTTSTTTSSTVTTGGVPGSGGKGESGGKEDGKDDGDKEKGKCEKNSSDEGCGGAAANLDGKTFYAAKDKTFSGVLSKASTDLKGSGIGGAFTGFFNVASGGSCPVSQWHIPYINADLTFDFMCQPFALDAMLIIKGVLLLIASFMAFRIAFE